MTNCNCSIKVLRLNDECVIAGNETSACDLRDDRRQVTDRRLAQGLPSEAAADDALVDIWTACRQFTLGMEPGKSCGRSRPTRRAVDLAIGEDRHISSHYDRRHLRLDGL